VSVYYNEIDPKAAAWLRELIKEGHIADGVVDERSIEDVKPSEIGGFKQCHFFAGIGVWSYALRCAGIPDDFEVWTGSCPCFPVDTLIITDNGYVPIQDIKVGDRVLTHKNRFREVTHIGNKFSETVTIKGQGHWGLCSTPNHPFYARKRSRCYSRKSENYGKTLLGDAEWINAEDLSGYSWATVSEFPVLGKVPVFPEKDWNGREANLPKDVYSEDFAYFLGYWIGDGWVTGTDVIICGNKKDESFLHNVIERVGLSFTSNMERTTIKCRISSKLLSRWMTSQFGKGAFGKSIPTWLHRMPLSYREAFISGWRKADGHVGTQKKGSGKIRAITTVSKALAIAARILINQSGKSASITRHDPKRKCIIEGREVNEKGFYRITEYEKSKSFKFESGHGWGANRSMCRCRIEQRVYNIAVEEDESYTADGIVVHNCQPFSTAGKGEGFDDERHLWPSFHWLIKECRPQLVFGEQVAGKAGETWLDLVSTDLEGESYAIGSAVTAACGFGAPHQRKRLYWVAERSVDDARDGTAWSFIESFSEQGWRTVDGRGESIRQGHGKALSNGGGADSSTDGLADTSMLITEHTTEREGRGNIERGSTVDRMADSDRRRCEQRDPEQQEVSGAVLSGTHGNVGESDSERLDGQRILLREEGGGWEEGKDFEVAGDGEVSSGDIGGSPLPVNGFWGDADWLRCRDGKWRCVEPGTFPLADGVTARVGLLRGYGNAIVSPQAQAFIESYFEAVYGS
jgi:site-specific DNA-cytosine methylase